MEEDEIQAHGTKFPRTSSNVNPTRISETQDQNQNADEEREDKGGGGRRNLGGHMDFGGGTGRFYGWPSSRIVRVSRASGGKDRHSKVLTSKGLRDRRVRLSVSTAIQFYDLQDRLGVDQPSKAVEWLLKAASSSIAELPPMSPFPDTPNQDEKRSSTASGPEYQHRFEFPEAEVDGGTSNCYQQQPQQHVTTLSKSSACSSNSETSKGSGPLLSRSESRVKARERAKERVAEKEKEKEKENESSDAAHLNAISHTTSFTELLSSGVNNVNHHAASASPNGSVHHNSNGTNGSSFFQKTQGPYSSTSMDYLSSGLLGPLATRPGQIHLGNLFSQSVSSPLFSDNHPELHNFSFVSDHLAPVVTTTAGGGNGNNHQNGTNEYNLNFTISSSGLAGYSRGTLQSNSSSSLVPYLHRYSPNDGFFIGSAAAPVENHQSFLPGFDARLQLYYGEPHGNGRHSGQKGKGKH